MIRAYAALAALGLALLTHPAGAFQEEPLIPLGPVFVRNASPTGIAVPYPVMETARCEDAFGLHASYSSTIMLANSPVGHPAGAWDVNVDMETAVLDLSVSATVDAWGVELSVLVPMVSYRAGFLDSPINSWHDLLGLEDYDYGRSTRPENQFLFEVKRDGLLVMDGVEGEWGLGDVRVGVKKSIVARPEASMSISAVVEVPSGDAAHGYGNGSPDLFIAALADLKASETLWVYLNGGLVVPGDLKGAATTVDLTTMLYAGAEVRWIFLGQYALAGQFMAASSPYDTGIDALDGLSTLASVALEYHPTVRSSIHAAFTEDPTTTNAPDVGASVGYAYRF